MAKEIEIDIVVDTSEAIKGVDSLADSTDKLADSTEGVVNSSKDLNAGLKKVGSDGARGLKKVATGFKGVGIAIKAAGIGLVIAAFAALKEILEKQQPVLDFVDSAFTAIGLAVSQVSESIKSSGAEFSALGTIMGDVLNLSLTPLKVAFFSIKGAILGAQLIWEQSFFGGNDEKKIEELKLSLSEVGDELIDVKDGVVKSVVSIKENIGEAIEEVGVAAKAINKAVSDLDKDLLIAQAKRTTALKNEAQIREAINRGIFEQYDREAELLRQQRDDINLTIEERQKANKELGIVLQEQERIMLENAAIVERAAQAEFNANKTTENRVALIEAQNEQEAIRADLTGKRSEQLVNEAALEKERLDNIALEDKERKDKASAEEKTRIENEAAQKKAAQQSVQDGINSVSNLTSTAFALADSLGAQDEKSKEKRAKKNFNIQKGIQLALAGVDASKAITASLAQSPIAIGPVPNPAGIASLAFAATNSALSIATIAASQYKGGAKTPTAPTTPSGGGAASAPAISEDTLFTSQNLDGAESESVDSNRGLNQLKAIVVESDITRVQNNINDIETRSEIG
jgi:hypothetical protein